MKFGTSILRGLIFGRLTLGGNFVLVSRGLILGGLIFGIYGTAPP